MDDSGKVPLGDWMETAFQDIATHGSTALVLDLRGNGGGRDALGRQLLQHLVDQPFQYYDDLVINSRTASFGRYQAEPDTVPEAFVEEWKDGKLHAVKHPNWGTHSPAAPVFGGRVFALVDGASFSTTCEFLSHVRNLGRATVIGQESGGAYVGNTSGFISEIRLPHTGVVIGVPRMRYDLAVKPAKPFGRGILPDVAVSYDIQERLAAKDKELEIALAMARTPPGTP
jgi:C-terminal processing protease CtpA/Prc